MLEFIWIVFVSILSVLLVAVCIGIISEKNAANQKQIEQGTQIAAKVSRKLKEMYDLNPHISPEDVRFEYKTPEELSNSGSGLFMPSTGEVIAYTDINTRQGIQTTTHELDHRALYLKMVAPTKKLRRQLYQEWSNNKEIGKWVYDELSNFPENPATNKIKEYAENPLTLLAMNNFQSNDENDKNPLETFKLLSEVYGQKDFNPLEIDPDVEKYISELTRKFIEKYIEENKDKSLLVSAPQGRMPILEASAYYLNEIEGREDVVPSLRKYGTTKEEKERYMTAFLALKDIHDTLTGKDRRHGSKDVVYSEEDAAKIVKSTLQYVDSVKELDDISINEYRNGDILKYAKIAQKSGTGLTNIFGEYRGASTLKNFKNRDSDLK